MSLHTSPAEIIGNRAVDLRAIDLTGLDRRRMARSRIAGRFAKDGVTLSLVHLDVALAVTAERDDAGQAGADVASFKVSAKRLAHGPAAADTANAIETSSDPVIARLTEALAATEAANAPHSAICSDALRLAILARQFSHQPDATAVAADTECRNVRSLQKWRLKRVVQYVDEHLGARITLQDLATVAGLSRMHFAAQFRAAMGMRPHEYLLKRRIERAEELLKQAEVSLVNVALTVGFQTQAHFTTVFKRFAGDTPYQWRSAWLALSTPLPRPQMSLS